jgi:class 3 adenylate cyclase
MSETSGAISASHSVELVELIVVFVDLRGFTIAAQRMSTLDLCELLAGFYEMVRKSVEASGGNIIKYIGDAAMITFPVERASEAARELLKLMETTDVWGAATRSQMTLDVKMHRGEVGRTVTTVQGQKLMDVFGATVNAAAALRSHGLAMSPEAFRSLNPETRKLFKKHTPPITYIPNDQRRRY